MTGCLRPCTSIVQATNRWLRRSWRPFSTSTEAWPVSQISKAVTVVENLVSNGCRQRVSTPRTQVSSACTEGSGCISHVRSCTRMLRCSLLLLRTGGQMSGAQRCVPCLCWSRRASVPTAIPQRRRFSSIVSCSLQVASLVVFPQGPQIHSVQSTRDAPATPRLPGTALGNHHIVQAQRVTGALSKVRRRPEVDGPSAWGHEEDLVQDAVAQFQPIGATCDWACMRRRGGTLMPPTTSTPSSPARRASKAKSSESHLVSGVGGTQSPCPIQRTTPTQESATTLQKTAPEKHFFDCFACSPQSGAVVRFSFPRIRVSRTPTLKILH